MDESDGGPITRNEYDPSADRRWLNKGLLIAFSGGALLLVLDHYVPMVHRLGTLYHHYHFWIEGGGFALSGLAVFRRAIKRRFSRRPIEQMPDGL